MAVNAHRNDFADNAPRELICALQDAGSARQLSRHLKVNIFYVTQLIYKGIEPTDKTANGRKVRVKLFLPARKPHEVEYRREKAIIEAMANITRQALRWKNKSDNTRKAQKRKL